MRLPISVVQAIWRRLEPVIQRVPDEIIGHNARWRARRPDGTVVDRPFLLRWFTGAEKRPFGCGSYLHQFIRDDEDRALHDHPWPNASLLLGGQYIEHTVLPGGVHWRELFRVGDVKLRAAKAAHRVELTSQWVTPTGVPILGNCPERAPNLPTWVRYSQTKSPSWSLFLTGPVQRPWGFHCPETGWRESHEFHERGGCT